MQNSIGILFSYLAFLAIGVFIGLAVYHIRQLRLKQQAKMILNEARREAEKMKKELNFEFRKEIQEKRLRFQSEMKKKEEKFTRFESQIIQREKEIRRESNQIQMNNVRLESREKKINEQEELIVQKVRQAEKTVEEQNKILEQVSGLGIDEAKKQLLHNLENRVKIDAAQMVNDIKSEARERANRDAKEIIATAIENLAYEFTMESTLSTVELPNERFKGMIIGKEGRNIKAFEEATGVKVIVDDTPELVVLSGYDPVAREIARIAMTQLIKGRNIHQKTIQQAVQKATSEVRRNMQMAAEETLRELKLAGVHPLMREHLGRLLYRYSYGQNMLQHSKEVAYLSGALAAELGFNVKLARRAGLFHDIGKAVSNNSEGSHVTLGVELATKCNEHEVVINAILAHHEEAEPISPISVLVTAADKISGSRPGARRDSLEAYTKRITKLEEIGNSFEGVSNTYAISAGREVRIIVEPEKISDEKVGILSSDIAAKIKETMEYPGQIKVCVIRRTITSRYTDDYEETMELDEKA